jgi:hypothetical protein
MTNDQCPMPNGSITAVSSQTLLRNNHKKGNSMQQERTIRSA